MIYRRFGLGLLAWCLFTVAADAKPRAPIVDATLGPVARNAMPVILISRALNPRDYAATGDLAGAVIGAFSDADYQKVSKRAAETVRAAVPSLDVERELRAAFRCGETDSLCTDMAVLPQSSSEPLDAALLAQLHSHQWTEARLVSFWWHLDEPRLSAHVALDIIELAPAGKSVSSPSVRSWATTGLRRRRKAQRTRTVPPYRTPRNGSPDHRRHAKHPSSRGSGISSLSRRPR